MRKIACLLSLLFPLAILSGTFAEEEEFIAKPLTEEKSFTGGIEGPACDQFGNIFAVNFEKQGTIGRVKPNGKAIIYQKLPKDSIGNGIRFDREGNMYIADYVNHNVFVVDAKNRKLRIFAHSDRMNQPNDLAIAPDGTLYTSDPDWRKGTGQLWRIDRDGKIARLASTMGTTNGIEVSPDGKTLYVNESVQLSVWAFSITEDRKLVNKKLIKLFKDFGLDGMRCDVDGNLYITRHGKGTVIKMTPEGRILKEVNILGKMPTNLCFGGPDGRTVYVTEAEKKRLVQFRVDRPGATFERNRREPT